MQLIGILVIVIVAIAIIWLGKYSTKKQFEDIDIKGISIKALRDEELKAVLTGEYPLHIIEAAKKELKRRNIITDL